MNRTAVVIPCFKVKAHVLDVIAKTGSEVEKIYAVDDACPEQSGEFIKANCRDPRVVVLKNDRNLGVGGAVKSGYVRALTDGMTVVVKVDGDGQMNPKLIPSIIRPILEGTADYTKGNRFHKLESLKSMPTLRLIGNALLSFVSKVSTGYWNVMDPTNGFTAIHAAALKSLPLEKIDNRYFFETDMLFRLYTVRAVVADIPMDAAYGEEKSGLSVSHSAFSFPLKHLSRFYKRIFYCYFLRDFTAASIQLVVGKLASIFGFIFGFIKWRESIETGHPATSGTVMLAALPILLGVQLLLSAFSFDTQNIPNKPLQKY